MLIVETIARIRREHFIKGKTIKEIARDLKVSPRFQDRLDAWCKEGRRGETMRRSQQRFAVPIESARSINLARVVVASRFLELWEYVMSKPLKSVFLGSATIAIAGAILTAFPTRIWAQAQPLTCTDGMNSCLQRIGRLSNPDPERCKSAFSSCMKSGTFVGPYSGTRWTVEKR
jgi:hypothetical protein